MLGFGALKGMNDTMKQNRDLLKANKKKSFEKTGYTTRVSENLFQNDKKLSDTDRMQLVQATWQSNHEESRKQILGLLISVVVVGAMVATFILWCQQR